MGDPKCFIRSQIKGIPEVQPSTAETEEPEVRRDKITDRFKSDPALPEIYDGVERMEENNPIRFRNHSQTRQIHKADVTMPRTRCRGPGGGKKPGVVWMMDT